MPEKRGYVLRYHFLTEKATYILVFRIIMLKVAN